MRAAEKVRAETVTEAELAPEHPWERDPVLDTDEAWAAFVHFRDLPPSERSRQRVADDLKLGLNTVAKMSARGLWRLRAHAYDQHQDREVCRIRLADRRKSARRHVDLAMGLLEVAAAETQRLLDEVRKPGATRRLKPREIIQLAEFGVRYERLVRGAVTDRVGVEDLTKFTDEELGMAEQLRAKLEGTIESPSAE